jgi:hypothetical protein
MQGPFGTTEAINITGTAISPVVTWVRFSPLYPQSALL